MGLSKGDMDIIGKKGSDLAASLFGVSEEKPTSYSGRLVRQCITEECRPGGRCCFTKLFSITSAIALFVIACIVVANGGISTTMLSKLSIGLAAGAFLINLSGGRVKERGLIVTALAVVTAVCVTLGGLGLAGVLSGTQIGWGVIGAPLAGSGLLCLKGCYDGNRALSAATNELIKSMPNES